MPLEPLKSSLLLDVAGRATPGRQIVLAAALAEADPVCDCNNLVQRTMNEAPEQVVCVAEGLAPELVAALSAWDGDPPCPVLLLSTAPPADPAEAARAVALGIHQWQHVTAEAEPAAVAAQLAVGRALAHARWQHERALRRALARAQGQLDERKWVDRAKGVLMSGRGLAEDEAFGLLRNAAMNANLRVGELARAVCEAAGWAHALNRAGQLRMLSQRFVRLAAQRLLKIGPRAAATLQEESARRVLDNLAVLARHCDGTPAAMACAEAARCWDRLAAELQARLDRAALARIDANAAALLAAAEHLTQILQTAAGRRSLHIINLCGRQRMRVQRIAKEHLLALLDAPAGVPNRPGQGVPATLLDEFERAQRELEEAPLSSPGIRTALAQVRDDWLRLLAGLRTPDTHAGARAMAQASETLLERLDGLTLAYERSLQVIMG
jgi:AmiR/NasT family two-component response regulator